MPQITCMQWKDKSGNISIIPSQAVKGDLSEYEDKRGIDDRMWSLTKGAIIGLRAIEPITFDVDESGRADIPNVEIEYRSYTVKINALIIDGPELKSCLQNKPKKNRECSGNDLF